MARNWGKGEKRRAVTLIFVVSPEKSRELMGSGGGVDRRVSLLLPWLNREFLSARKPSLARVNITHCVPLPFLLFLLLVLSCSVPPPLPSPSDVLWTPGAMQKSEGGGTGEGIRRL